ncbi:hypothetical protein PSACC_01010 [Paramicrosporidium saccamoebae]|uniref:Uncharacterized protein n=1 Tax=Paramicrosporidium saccamoebae TaxID=1246581 RepID=A0A2H9TN19_9FUNG|nr:hypothetical protein PSACC_01010 [Paramicrosporidium saccamoebae]
MESEQPRFLKICSITTAARTAIFSDLVWQEGCLEYHCQRVCSARQSRRFAGCPQGSLRHKRLSRQRRRTLILIFILLDGLAVMLNIIATIIVGVNLSKMTLYRSLCDSPGDCPRVFDLYYVLGVVLVSIVLSILCFTAYIDYARFLERSYRERQQAADLRKRGERITTDVQTSLNTPRSTKSLRGSIVTRFSAGV